MATIDLRNMITPEKNFPYFSAFISSFMGRYSRKSVLCIQHIPRLRIQQLFMELIRNVVFKESFGNLVI